MNSKGYRKKRSWR